jgi:tight adherence protein B
MNAWLISAGVFAGSMLLTVVALTLATASFWRVGRRLRIMEQKEQPRHADATNSDHVPQLAAMLEHTRYYGTLERMLAQAGSSWQPGEFVAAWVMAALAAGTAGWLLRGPLVAVAAALGIVVAAWAYLYVRQMQRLRQFEAQLADALMLMASSIRSGYGVLRSMQAIRDEMKPPIAVEFGKVIEETSVGMSIQDALVKLTQRVPLPDLDIAVTAILIHLDVGGNLAELIEIVAATVRERQRVRAEVNILTTEGRLSGVILFLLPIVMGFVLSALNPVYMSALFHTPFGHVILILGGVLQTIGGIVIMRMLEVDF